MVKTLNFEEEFIHRTEADLFEILFCLSDLLYDQSFFIKICKNRSNCHL